ncbi:hypothetical protein LMG7141_00794 [Ralstonia condita]|uniref:Uncharacterized protein n=1 Tax=Ralstonia condita TaxID=3058600 RepID=A0ABN9IHC6_9RALS|nr:MULTISPECIES: hypothetical protein [Ralstonia]CAJ0778745.1 hypothetical protein LMG7141_00794 [Ralstonia sp. LMG 7141]CAJ0802977.1 hypothetical protein LMG18090_04369 [Ralstonia mannitolilytica]
MIGEIVPAMSSHARQMAPRMRAAEVQEVADSYGMSPLDALLFEVKRSSVAWSWVIDGEVACMFGIVTPAALSEVSYPWFLTTELVEQHSRQFARACKTLLPELLAHHPRMVGRVDARYMASVRWLQWLGAKLGEPEPWGVGNALFRTFEIGG